jgi:hypothetical protein
MTGKRGAGGEGLNENWENAADKPELCPIIFRIIK